MKITVQVVIEAAPDRPASTETIAELTREELSPATLGLSLAEAKTLLAGVQANMVTQQVEQYLAHQQHCPDCGRQRARKGAHTLRYRTLFGTIQLPSPRFYTCSCRGAARGSHSPLARMLSERSAPELRYQQVKWASLMSYGLSVDLLGDVLPLGAAANVASIHRQVTAVAERVDQALGDEQWAFIEGCQNDWDRLPRPPGLMTVGLDGGYVRGRNTTTRKAGCFELIVGKSIPEEHAAKCFGFVNGYDAKPKRRLFELLRSQGLQMNQSVTFLSDGGDTVRELPLYLCPESEHLLDWFHVTMRITVMRQYVKGLASKDKDRAALNDQLERIKWLLWHGNVFRAQQEIDDLEDDLACWERPCEMSKKLEKAVHEFHTYIANNASFIPNYGERYRAGERISTGFVESTVNQVISKRFVKQQQMRWTKAGAHRLLQVRLQTLNDDLRTTFEQWYPAMRRDQHPQQLAA